MSMLALVVAAVSMGFSAIFPAGPLPEIANQLPPTWPPPGWTTGVSVPGQPVKPATAPTTQPVEADKWVDAFPHVRVNRGRKAVEFDALVAWDFHDADAPRTELELLVCLPLRDKEHESLLLSRAKGAHVHAALLMAGLEPGTPGKIEFGEKDALFVRRTPPKGPAVSVTFTYLRNGKEVTDQALTWVIDEKIDEPPNGELINRASLPKPRSPVQSLVFGGSRVGQMKNEHGEKVNVYDADEMGCLIGLCTFGGETIGLSEVVSPDSGLDAPRFVANSTAIPPATTSVRVRITPSVRPPAALEQGAEEERAFPGLSDSLRDR